MATDEDDEAKQLMYLGFRAGPWMPIQIGLNFVQMDGLKGLLFAAEHVGRLLLSGATIPDVDWITSVAI